MSVSGTQHGGRKPMETVKDILADTNSSEWSSESQQALASLLKCQAEGRSIKGIVGQTDTVWNTFIRIASAALTPTSDVDPYIIPVSRCGGALVARIKTDQEYRFPHGSVVEVRRVEVRVIPLNDDPIVAEEP